MRRDAPRPRPALLPSLLLLVLLAAPLVRAAPDDNPNIFQRMWRGFKTILFGTKPTTPTPTWRPEVELVPRYEPEPETTTAFPTVSAIYEPVARATSAAPAVEPSVQRTTPSVAPTAAPTTTAATTTTATTTTMVPPPPEDPSPVEAASTSGQGSEIIPWWVGLLTGLTLAGWIAACAVVLAYRRGCFSKPALQRPGALEMAKLPSPLTLHRFGAPPPYYENPSYVPSRSSLVSPDGHIYEEPQLPSCGHIANHSEKRASKRASISKRPPAVPYRPEDSNDAVRKATGFDDASEIHRNSLYNTVLPAPEEASGVCRVCSVGASIGCVLTNNGEPAVVGSVTEGAGEGLDTGRALLWRFLHPRTKSSADGSSPQPHEYDVPKLSEVEKGNNH